MGLFGSKWRDAWQLLDSDTVVEDTLHERDVMER